MLTPKARIPLYAMLILLFLLLYAVLTVYFNYKYANIEAPANLAPDANEIPPPANNPDAQEAQAANEPLPGNASANEPGQPLNSSQNSTNATG